LNARVVVIGAGAVGARAARQLLVSDDIAQLVLVGRNVDKTTELARSFDDRVRVSNWRRELLDQADVVVLAQPEGHRRVAEYALERNVGVVSCADSITEVQELLALDAEAIERNTAVIVGAAFAPGLSCVLAQHASHELDQVTEIHVAKFGTGGPACARRHHRGLATNALDWRDGAWRERRAGSGRELVWFPDPVAGRDCYRAAEPDALLLQPAFGDVARITSRLAATRRDRITAHLPMLRRPHPEGTIGAIRVEVRGIKGDGRETITYGVIERPAVGAGVVLAVATLGYLRERSAGLAMTSGFAMPGVSGLAQRCGDTTDFLAQLSVRGVRAAVLGQQP
jgi:saccharopine dehydrogenase-like NADP-dependent oxidoreductase